MEHYSYEEAKKSVEESMRKLKTDYLDLVLLHQPFGDAYSAYRALEDLYDEGKIRAIGISNFYVDRMVDFASFNRIKPMVNQVETHIFNQQKNLKEWADKYGIQLEAWAPFGEGRGGTFDNPVIGEDCREISEDSRTGHVALAHSERNRSHSEVYPLRAYGREYQCF